MTPIDPKHTALLVMDYQRTILENFLPASDAASVISHMPDLIGEMRQAEMRVIYVTVAFRPDYVEVSPRNTVFSGLRNTGLLRRGDSGTAVHPDVAPQTGDPVITKHRISAFSNTELDTILRAQDVRRLILAGVTTSGVVLSTARQAFDLDYQLIIASDCCADSDPEIQNALMQKIFPHHAEILKNEEIINIMN